MNRPVEIGARALRDIEQARAWFDAQERGLGEHFLNRVNDTIHRLAQNPEQYQVRLLDLRQPRSGLSNTRSAITSLRMPASWSRACRIDATLR